MPRSIQPGIDVLLNEHSDLLSQGRWALLSHPAGVDSDGRPSAEGLRDRLGPRLTALFGPEHGFFGRGGPGEPIKNDQHPAWHIPIHSLYGDAWRAKEKWTGWDTMVVDFQDLAVRCYTYVSTMRQVLEEAARRGKRVVVTDRPVPYVRTVDGPMLEESCRSFVGAIPAPLVYGMTPGETALWLTKKLDLAVDLVVIPVKGYRRNARPERVWPHWIPPSPAIRAWSCAMLYPVTVFTEALPMLDCARSTDRAFQILRAPWLDATELKDALKQREVAGLGVTLYRDPAGEQAPGVRMAVTRPAVFRPVFTALTLLHLIQNRYGQEKLWGAPSVRPRFFDQLMGSSEPRQMLMSGATPAEIAQSWKAAHRAFERERAAILLYR